MDKIQYLFQNYVVTTMCNDGLILAHWLEAIVGSLLRRKELGTLFIASSIIGSGCDQPDPLAPLKSKISLMQTPPQPKP